MASKTPADIQSESAGLNNQSMQLLTELYEKATPEQRDLLTNLLQAKATKLTFPQLLNLKEFIGICLHDIKFRNRSDSANSERRASETSGTTSVSGKQVSGGYWCTAISPWALDLNQTLNEFIATYDNGKTFKDNFMLQPPLFDDEVNMNGYLFPVINSFLVQINKNCFNSPEDSSSSMNISTRGGAHFKGDPDFSVKFKAKNKQYLTFIEMKRESMFETDKIFKFFNECQIRLKEENCGHYVCMAIQQVFTYMCDASIQYSMLSTYEKSYLCKTDQDGETMHIAGPFKRKGNETSEAISFFSVITGLLSLTMISSDSSQVSVRNSSRPIPNAIGEDGNGGPRRSGREEGHKPRETYAGTSQGPRELRNGKFRLDPCSKSNSRTLQMPSPTIESLEIGRGVSAYLGYGRTGKVFKGKADGIDVAVKVADVFQMSPEKRKMIVGEMRNEAMMLDYLNRCGFRMAPRIFYSGYYSGIYYVNVTELIAGKHKSVERMSETEKINVRYAVDRLHDLKVLHNDLKPDNILIGEDGRVTVIDFGFAEITKKRSIKIEHEDRYDIFLELLFS